MSIVGEPAVWFPTIRAGTGADVFVQRLCKGLNDRRIRAEIAWLPLRAEYAPWTVTAPKVPDWANVVHVNSWLPRRFWPTDLPVVLTVFHLVHDPAYRPFRSYAQAIYHEAMIRPRELAAIRGAGLVVAQSNYVRGTVEAFSGRRGIDMIYNWVDCERFSPSDDPPRNSDTPFRLFMAGSHSRRKGFDLLPDFVEKLGPDFEIRYAGGVARRGASIHGVTELGRISEAALVGEYRACDAVVSLSRYEGFGYTALEAMACGKPVVGFRCAAVAEVVADGETALLSDINDINSMANSCLRLAADRAFSIAMGKAGRERAISEFSETRALDAYLSIYRALVPGRITGEEKT